MSNRRKKLFSDLYRVRKRMIDHTYSSWFTPGKSCVFLNIDSKAFFGKIEKHSCHWLQNWQAKLRFFFQLNSSPHELNLSQLGAGKWWLYSPVLFSMADAWSYWALEMRLVPLRCAVSTKCILNCKGLVWKTELNGMGNVLLLSMTWFTNIYSACF